MGTDVGCGYRRACAAGAVDAGRVATRHGPNCASHRAAGGARRLFRARAGLAQLERSVPFALGRFAAAAARRATPRRAAAARYARRPDLLTDAVRADAAFPVGRLARPPA